MAACPPVCGEAGVPFLSSRIFGERRIRQGDSGWIGSRIVGHRQEEDGKTWLSVSPVRSWPGRKRGTEVAAGQVAPGADEAGRSGGDGVGRVVFVSRGGGHAVQVLIFLVMGGMSGVRWREDRHVPAAEGIRGGWPRGEFAGGRASMASSCWDSGRCSPGVGSQQ